MSAVAQLREATRPAHERVDASFARFDLRARDGYGRMLMAHARALPAVEAALADDQALPAWRPRMPLLIQDLADLSLPMPDPLPLLLPDFAGRLGLLYVLEGSRLGGVYLARQVPAELPSRYLAARHEAGEWRGLLQAIDHAAEGADDAWLQRMLDGAGAGFALYQSAADAA